MREKFENKVIKQRTSANKIFSMISCLILTTKLPYIK